MTAANEGGAMLDRAFGIIKFVTDAGRAVTVPEVIEGVGLPRPTVHRIVSSLEDMGLLARDLARNRVVVGPALTRLSIAALASTEAALQRRAILRRAVDEVLESVTLTVLDHDELLFLDRVESASPLRVQLFAGSRAPLHCTSGGKLFMAMQTTERRSRWLATCSLTRFTENTITDAELLKEELVRIRRERISVDNQEYIEGLTALAVPVIDKRGKMIAAISVNGPSSRLRLDERDKYVETLRQAAVGLRACLTDTRTTS